MNKTIKYICLAILLAGFTTSGLAQERVKLAQTGLQFLSVISDAQASAMGNAATTAEMGSSSLLFNPAGMASGTGFLHTSFSLNEWIADIKHNTFSLSVRPSDGKYGVLGVSVISVDYGEVLGTVVAENENGYLDTGVIKPSAAAFGVGYAKALSDRFSVGGQVRFVRQTLGSSIIPLNDSLTTTVENEVSPLSFDFGTLFKTGLKSVVFGMSVRNFSQEIEYAQEGFQLPLVFTIGLSADVLDFTGFADGSQSLLLHIDATHPRSYPEQLLMGLEYKLIDVLSLRGGYVTRNDEQGPTFGFGISQFGLQVDYAYTPFGVFDNVQRITARFSY